VWPAPTSTRLTFTRVVAVEELAVTRETTNVIVIPSVEVTVAD